MLLTITTTHEPATDLGYLLHKNPARPQSFALSFGQAHVFYPEASDARCTAALLLDVDPIGLVRGRGGRDNAASAASAAFGLEQYVNDRPYAASSRPRCPCGPRSPSCPRAADPTCCAASSRRSATR